MSKEKVISKPELFIPFNYKNASNKERIIYFFTVIIALLHISSIFFQSVLNWGVHHISFLNPIIQVIFTLFWISIFTSKGQAIIYYLFVNSYIFLKKIPVFFRYTLIISVSTLLFWIFRVQIFILGDSYSILRAMTEKNVSDWINREPLAAKIYSIFLDFFKKPGFESVYLIFIVLSILSGIIVIYNLIQIAKTLGKNLYEKYLIFSFIILSGSSLLFFGYAENYPIIFVSLSFYILFSLKYLQNKIPIYYPLITYAIIFSLHLGVVSLFPSLIYLIYLDYKRKNSLINLAKYFLILSFCVSLLFLFSGYSLNLFIDAFRGKSDPTGSHLVPLFSTWSEFHAYTMFSVWHILDFLNHHFTLNPLNLFYIIIILLFGLKVINLKDRIFNFLSISFIFSIAMEFVLNHNLAMWKDWDIIAPYIIIYSLLCVYLMINKLPLTKNNYWIIPLTTGVLLLHTLPYILVYSNEEQAISRTKILRDERVMSKNAIIVNNKHLSDHYYWRKHDPDKAIETIQNTISFYPNDPRGYLYLSQIYRSGVKNLQKSMEILELAESRGVNDLEIIETLGKDYFENKKYDSAISKYCKAIGIDSNCARYQVALGAAYGLKGEYINAIKYTKKGTQIDSNDYNGYKNLGVFYLSVADTINTIKSWNKCLEKCPKNSDFEQVKKSLESIKIISKK